MHEVYTALYVHISLITNAVITNHSDVDAYCGDSPTTNGISNYVKFEI